MAGLVKAKKYEWKDTNLALFGSDEEKKVSFSSKMAAVFRWYVYSDCQLKKFVSNSTSSCLFRKILRLEPVARLK